jgi:hypothetical protein
MKQSCILLGRDLPARIGDSEGARVNDPSWTTKCLELASHRFQLVVICIGCVLYPLNLQYFHDLSLASLCLSRMFQVWPGRKVIT